MNKNHLISLLLALTQLSTAYAAKPSQRSCELLLGVKNHAGASVSISRALQRKLASMRANQTLTASVLTHPEVVNVQYIETYEDRPEIWDPNVEPTEPFPHAQEVRDYNTVQEKSLLKKMNRIGVKVLSKDFIYSGYLLFKIQGSKRAVIELLRLKTTVSADLKMNHATAEKIASSVGLEEQWITQRRDDPSLLAQENEDEVADPNPSLTQALNLLDASQWKDLTQDQKKEFLERVDFSEATEDEQNGAKAASIEGFPDLVQITHRIKVTTNGLARRSDRDQIAAKLAPHPGVKKDLAKVLAALNQELLWDTDYGRGKVTLVFHLIQTKEGQLLGVVTTGLQLGKNDEGDSVAYKGAAIFDEKGNTLKIEALQEEAL